MHAQRYINLLISFLHYFIILHSFIFVPVSEQPGGGSPRGLSSDTHLPYVCEVQIGSEEEHEEGSRYGLQVVLSRVGRQRHGLV